MSDDKVFSDEYVQKDTRGKIDDLKVKVEAEKYGVSKPKRDIYTLKVSHE